MQNPANDPMSGTCLGGWIRTRELWFDEPLSDLTGIDIVHCRQRSQAISEQRWLYFYTILIDLSRSPEELFLGLGKSTANGVRRARDAEAMTCLMLASPSTAEIYAFADFHDDANARIGLPPVNREELEQLRQAGLLVLSCVQSRDGVPLAWHSYVCHRLQQRARCLHSATSSHSIEVSAQRNLIGRANRLLHYQDMLAFRAEGIRTYDFGGWYAGTEDAKRLNINRFKEGFGGKIVCGFDCEEPLTWKGRLFLFLRDLKYRLFAPSMFREIKRRRQTATRLPPEPV